MHSTIKLDTVVRPMTKATVYAVHHGIIIPNRVLLNPIISRTLNLITAQFINLLPRLFGLPVVKHLSQGTALLQQDTAVVIFSIY